MWRSFGRPEFIFVADSRQTMAIEEGSNPSLINLRTLESTVRQMLLFGVTSEFGWRLQAASGAQVGH